MQIRMNLAYPRMEGERLREGGSDHTVSMKWLHTHVWARGKYFY